MATHRLHDDLLQEFREEQSFVNEQLRIMDPLAVALRKPAAQRVMGKGLIMFGELLCWLAALAFIAFIILIVSKSVGHAIHLLIPAFNESKQSDVNNSPLLWLICSMAGLLAIAFFFLARTLAGIRHKNTILSHAGRDIKVLAGRLLNRKAAIDAVDQRHFSELPPLPVTNTQVNDVLNPGY